MIGETVRDKLFGGQNPVGSEIRIKQFACEVIGLLKSKGQSAMGSDQDDTVIMPLRTVQRRLTGSQDVNRLMVSVADGRVDRRGQGADHAAAARAAQASARTRTTTFASWTPGRSPRP